MPPPIAVLSVEFALIFAGLALLWQLALNPAARARPAPSLLPKWDLPFINFLLFLWCVLAGGVIGQFLALGALRWGAAASPETRRIIVGAGFQLGLLAGCIGFRRLSSKYGPANASTWTPRPVNALIAGSATFLVAMPLLAIMSLAWQFGLERLGIPAERQDLFDLFTHAKSPALLTLLIVLAIVVAPVTEELIFRAGIFRYVRQRLPRWPALLLPACLFGALHANLASFAPLVVLGLVFSLAYERTGNIAVPMVAHGLFNLNTLLLVYAGVGL
ncbi:MAG: CPBP family intramembrane metalloprotease [Opitutaceae bacterium]|nr:CPBP family intramembrane metalloprotease [Opitutaceae bacterium]